jgi:hypothetical protein
VTDVAPQQSVRLFTKAEASVRLCVRDGPAGFQLVIFGPGNASAEFDFAELENLERFRDKYERDLIAGGFRLHTVGDRRSGIDRRQVLRIAAGERRRTGR